MTLSFKQLLAGLLLLACLPACAREPALDRLVLPPGFRVELLARIPGARQMAFGGENVLFVGSMREGKVHAIELDRRYRARRTVVVASGLQMPSGVAYRHGALYIGAGAIYRITYNAQDRPG